MRENPGREGGPAAGDRPPALTTESVPERITWAVLLPATIGSRRLRRVSLEVTMHTSDLNYL